MSAKAPSKLSFNYWESVPEESVRRAFWIFAGAILIFRLFVLAVIPLDLSGDEAYYWEWGRHLDWGYFSKPPGIGWLMALAGKIGGDTTFGIRMFAAFLGTGSLICLFLLALRLYGPAVAMITAFAFVANPANAALNLTLTIDAPLMFFWSLSLYAFWEFINAGQASCLSSENAETGFQPERSRPVSSEQGALASNNVSETGRMPVLPFFKSRGWWGTVLFIGLVGGMLSKQMMLVFHPVAVLFLALSKDYRAQLKQPVLWIILIGSLIAWLPPLWWNMQNEWVTVVHTMHHFETDTATIGKHIGRFFEYVGSQLGIITPVFYVLIMALVFAALRVWKRLADRERYLWLFGGPALLVILLMGLRQRINPNWPAVFYGSTIILLTGWAAGKWSLDLKLDHWRRAFPAGMKIAIGFAVTVYVVVFALSSGFVRLRGLDPTARIRGWSQLAKDVDAVRRELPNGEHLPLITQSHRFMTSELAFYLHDQPRVYIYNSDPSAIESQYDLWKTPATHLGEDALIIVQGDPKSIEAGLTNRFESVSIHGILHYPQQGRALQTVTLAIGHDIQRWPGLHEHLPKRP